jgi:hypothetical protein
MLLTVVRVAATWCGLGGGRLTPPAVAQTLVAQSLDLARVALAEGAFALGIV